MYTRLQLCAPLIYKKNSVEPGEWYVQGSGARILCFELNPAQYRSIEPEQGLFLGKLLFSGTAVPEDSGGFAANSLAETVIVPAGVYLFSQQHELLDRDACVEFAVEQQKDGLWEKHNLGNLLYIRFLFEDNKHVTQIFRPCLP